MSCICRVTPLRIFIRSIAEVQVPPTRTYSPALAAAVRRLTSRRPSTLKACSFSAAHTTQRHFHQSIQRFYSDSDFVSQDNGQAWAPTWLPPRFRPRRDPDAPDPRQKKLARQKLRTATKAKASSTKKASKRSRATRSSSADPADGKPELALGNQPVLEEAETTVSTRKLRKSLSAPTIRPKSKDKSQRVAPYEGKRGGHFDMSADDAHLDKLTDAILRASRAEKLTIGWAPTSPEEARERREMREGANPDRHDRWGAEKEQVEKKNKTPLWKAQKEALKRKFPEGWNPRRKLSPDAMEGIRALHAQFPDEYTTPVLANKFEVSPEAIRRILKSKWKPTEQEAADRTERWNKRGQRIWTQWSALGTKVPKKWREQGIRRDMMQTGHSGSYRAPKDTYVGLEREDPQEKEAWKGTDEEAPPSAARKLAASMM